MAKVTLPLLSGSVKGQFRNLMVFHANGTVSKYVKPRDPKTPAQMTERYIMADIATECHCMSKSMRAKVRFALELPRTFGDSNWIAAITQYLMQYDNQQWNEGYNTWLSFGSPGKENWVEYDPGRELMFLSGGCIFATIMGCYKLCKSKNGDGVVMYPEEANSYQATNDWCY